MFKNFFFQILLIFFITPNLFAQTQYFISSSEGNDKNDGLSDLSPWASLDRLNSEKLYPGDIVKFKRGDVFYGQLRIDESGLPEAYIQFTSYAEGDLPIIDGSVGRLGSALAAILIQDQDCIEINNLQIQNFRKDSRPNTSDLDAYGIWVKNTGKRNLKGFKFHNLLIEKIYPIKPRKSFNKTSVSGIRFETFPAKFKHKAVNTSDIYLHNNTIRHTARFGISLRHKPSAIKGITDTPLDYDNNVRIINNRCEDLGGSCVLMNGVWKGLLEKNLFIRSGALVEPELSVNRGSGAWFFRSRHIVAQHNIAYGSRGHNDSAGIHVDFANQDVLVQYNFTYDNEGYGTEILGKNKNIIWRYNISVGDGTRKINIKRPEGGKSNFPGKTIFVSDFAEPKRELSEDIYIYNNTYVINANSDPLIELNANRLNVWNNLFIVDDGSRLGRKVNLGWTKGEGINIKGNIFVGNISPNFIGLDQQSKIRNFSYEGYGDKPLNFAFPKKNIASDFLIKHPNFEMAEKGIFSHIKENPEFDYFNNVISNDFIFSGVGYAK